MNIYWENGNTGEKIYTSEGQYKEVCEVNDFQLNIGDHFKICRFKPRKDTNRIKISLPLTLSYLRVNT